MPCKERARDQGLCSLEKIRLQEDLTAVLSKESISEETVMYNTSYSVYCLLICVFWVLQKILTSPNSVILMLKIKDYIIIMQNILVGFGILREKEKALKNI